MRASALPILAVLALAAGCAGPRELTGAAAARSRGAAAGEPPEAADPGEPRPVSKPADPWLDPARRLASVNGKVITLGEVMHQMGPAYEQFLDQRDQLVIFVNERVKDLVLRRLVVDEAMRIGINPRDAEMEKDLEQQEKQAAARGTTIEQHLVDSGLTRREWDEQRREALCYLFARQHFSGLSPDRWYAEEHFRPSVDPYVSPEDLRRWGEKNPERTRIPETATLRILDLRRNSFGGPDEPEEVRWRLCAEAMDAVEARLRAGESFADVARECSHGPEAVHGGLLGPVVRKSPLRTEYLDWAFAEERQAGELSPRIRVPTGYVLLLLEAREPAREVPIEEWGPLVRPRLEAQRQLLAWTEAQIRLLEAATVSEPELRDSLLDTLHEEARRFREELE